MTDARNSATADKPGGGKLGGYAESMAELDQIMAAIDRDDVDIETLASQVERASQLITHCEAKLRAAELSLQKILAQPGDPPAADRDDGGRPPTADADEPF